MRALTGVAFVSFVLFQAPACSGARSRTDQHLDTTGARASVRMTHAEYQRAIETGGLRPAQLELVGRPEEVPLPPRTDVATNSGGAIQLSECHPGSSVSVVEEASTGRLLEVHIHDTISRPPGVVTQPIRCVTRTVRLPDGVGIGGRIDVSD